MLKSKLLIPVNLKCKKISTKALEAHHQAKIMSNILEFDEVQADKDRRKHGIDQHGRL